MAVLAMKRIYICGLRRDRKAILEAIQRLGVIEIQNFAPVDEVFRKEQMPVSNSEFERHIHDAESALEVLNTYNPEKGGLLSSFKGRDIIEIERYDTFKELKPRISESIKNILSKSKEIAEKNAGIIRNTQQIEMLRPWEILDIPLQIDGTEKTSVFIGAVPGEKSLDDLYELMTFPESAEKIPVDISIISKDKDQTCIMAVCLKEAKEKVGQALRSIGFAYPSVSSDRTPTDQIKYLEEEINKLKAEILILETEIKEYEKDRTDIKFYSDYMAIRQEKYQVTNNILQSDHTFILSGYVPEIYIKDVEEAVKDYPVSIETQTPEADEDVPVMLKNNAFSSSVQGVVASYSLPSKGEIDPSFLISIFYFVFFGFMLADIGIGALIAIGAGVLLLKNKNMERSLKENVKLFMFGGISAMIFGFIFGSFFGDAIPVVSREFFGHELELKPLWIEMTDNPMSVLTVALIMGIIHILTGMGVNAYQMIKQKNWKGVIFKVAVWYVILLGLIIKCISMQMIMDILAGGATPPISTEIGNIGLYVAGVGCLIVIVMGEYETRSWPKRLIKGAYAVYGITSYLSDVLSYSRLLALGLATGVISSVANMIGTMFGGGVIKVIVFILVFLIINAINIGINTLGAYVHTNRLQYVEFFGRFYEGGGRPFEPYNIKTKYYKFKEN